MAAPEETPPLDVRTVEEVTYTQPIPVPVQEELDSTLLLGERKVIQEGAPGLEERTDRITRRCGEEQAREALSSKVLTEPTPTRVAVGTAQGVEGAQGRFVWPCMGQITSPSAPDIFSAPTASIAERTSRRGWGPPFPPPRTAP